MADDFYYSYRILQDANGNVVQSTQEHASMAELWNSVANLRIWHNSRLSNILFIFLSYFGGLELVRLVNTCSLIVFISFFAKIVFRRFSCHTIIFAAAAFFLLVPVWTLACMWHVASLNYTLGAGCLSLFFWGFYKTRRGGGRASTVICTALCALLCGAVHEGMGVPLVGALVVHFFISRFRKEEVDAKVYIVYVIALVVPLSLLMTSPGLMKRIQGASGGSGQMKLFIMMSWIFMIKYLPLIVLFLCAVWRRRKEVLRSFSFLFAIASIGIALKSDGMWGGGYFYAGVSMLYFCGFAYRDAVVYKPWSFSLLSCAVVGMAVYHGFRFAHLDTVVKDIVQKGKENRLVCYDLPGQDGDIYYILSTSLPRLGVDGEVRSHLYSKLYGVPEFKVMFNQIPLSAGSALHRQGVAYGNCTGKYAGGEPVWVVRDGVSLLVLPENWIVPACSRQKAESKGVEYSVVEPCNCVPELELMKHLVGQPSLYASMACVDGAWCWAVDESKIKPERLQFEINNIKTGETRTCDMCRPE